MPRRAARWIAVLTWLAASPAQAAPSPADAADRDEPGVPQVDDPLLERVPPPARVLADWEDARSLMRSRSADLQVAYGDVQRAEAQARVALAAALPSLNLNASGTFNLLTNNATQISGVDANGNPTFRAISLPVQQILSGNLAAQVPLLNVRAWYAIGTAKQSAHATKLSAEDIKRTLTLSLASAVVSVFTAERVAEINRIGLRTALERLALTERRQSLGATSGLDVLRAQQDAEAARATLITGDESLRQAREALGQVLGLPEPVGVRADIQVEDLQSSVIGQCRAAQDIDQRADVAALRSRAELGARQVNDARLQFLPTVMLSSTLSTTSQDTGAIPRTLWNVQALLNVPLWDGGARYGALRDGEAQLGQALARLEAQRRQAALDASRAVRNVEVAARALGVAERARELADATDRLTRTAYTEGRGTSLELVTSGSALRQADATLALREFDVVRAKITAALALSTCTL